MRTRYFFDLRDPQGVIQDEEGMELSDVRTAQDEAARTLADMLRDFVQGEGGAGPSPVMAVEVRNDDGPVLQLKITLEVVKPH